MFHMADETLGAALEALRDSRRPPFELVREVVESCFGDMRISVEKITDGPESWIWSDTLMNQIGMPRYYILTRSLSEGLEGYPLLTVRQAYSTRLDTWITMSSLIVGPGEDGIVHTTSLLLAQHTAAVAGVRFAAKASADANGNPMVGIAAARYIMESKPPPADVLLAEPFDDELESLVKPPKDVN
jgi:hypothetical protein